MIFLGLSITQVSHSGPPASLPPYPLSCSPHPALKLPSIYFPIIFKPTRQHHVYLPLFIRLTYLVRFRLTHLITSHHHLFFTLVSFAIITCQISTCFSISRVSDLLVFPIQISPDRFPLFLRLPRAFIVKPNASCLITPTLSHLSVHLRVVLDTVIYYIEADRWAT
jgi:hypothetical protein